MKAIKRNYFLYLFCLCMASGLVLLIAFKKGQIVLFMNEYSVSPFMDFAFTYITYLGDGIILLALAILMLFVKYKYTVMTIFSGLFQLILVHINKRILFPDLVRPKTFLEGNELHFVEGVVVHGYNSFPSGHTTTAFAVFLLLSMVFTQPFLQGIFFLIAFLVGFSRLYLLQHFFIDVYFGAMLGIISTLLAVWLVEKYLSYSIFEKKLTIERS